MSNSIEEDTLIEWKEERLAEVLHPVFEYCSDYCSTILKYGNITDLVEILLKNTTIEDPFQLFSDDESSDDDYDENTNY